MPEPNAYIPQLIVPVGTRIVTRVATLTAQGGPTRPPGVVGAIVAAPSDALHAYHVRFVDGGEAALHRTEFAILKQYQQGAFDPTIQVEADLDVYGAYVIYRCIVGSRAYGLGQESSDVDLRGIYLPPADLQWSLYGMPEQLQTAAADTDECYWELQKFLTLALKANPNILECLYTPLVEEATELAQELRGMRDLFLSRLIYQSYGGYVFSQFKKLEQDLRTGGAIRWKHAMHLIRLLLAGITALREGYVPVHVGEHREELLAIRRAEMPWEAVNAWRLSLHQEFGAAFAGTHLPQWPDYDRANAFLIRARRSRV
jgi:predicted nucleotidyltransferase